MRRSVRCLFLFPLLFGAVLALADEDSVTLRARVLAILRDPGRFEEIPWAVATVRLSFPDDEVLGGEVARVRALLREFSEVYLGPRALRAYRIASRLHEPSNSTPAWEAATAAEAEATARRELRELTAFLNREPATAPTGCSEGLRMNP